MCDPKCVRRPNLGNPNPHACDALMSRKFSLRRRSFSDSSVYGFLNAHEMNVIILSIEVDFTDIFISRAMS